MDADERAASYPRRPSMAAASEEGNTSASASRKRRRFTLGSPAQLLSSEDEGTPDPARARPPSRVVIADVTVQDADALECGVCFFPLKPPIFQCEVGHVVCSPCRDKLTAAGKCHVCSVPTTGGYRRCHGMEYLVESIRVPCPNAAYGCAASLAYYDLRAHRRACAHAPCHCPGEACGFVGSMAALLGHHAAAHGWPCATRVMAGEMFIIHLHDGFNFLRADRGAAADDDHGSVVFLLNMTREPYGHAISVLCIHPLGANADDDDGHHGASSMTTPQCELNFARYDYNGDGGLCRRHYQNYSRFLVACTDLSNGLPDLGDCFQFLVPNSVLGDDGKAAIQVTGRVNIN